MTFDLANPDRKIHAGVLLMGDETEVLDVAPIDLLNGMSKEFVAVLPVPDAIKAQALDIEFHWVSENGKPARLTSGITMQCTDSFETCPPLDIVLMGARGISYVENEAEIAFIRKAYDESSAFLTICGGSESARQAGVLKGKTATAPRMMIEHLRHDAPETKWVEKRWVRDGKTWTSGTLLNGLNLMMQFARETWPAKREMIEIMIQIGDWPERDVEFPDVNGKM